MHYTFDDILHAAKDAVTHEPGNYRYVIVVLHRGDTSDAPGTTKHSLWGPKTYLWEITPAHVSAFEREQDKIPARLGAATLDMPVRS